VSPTPRRSLTPRVLMVLALATIVPTVIIGALAIRRARADIKREVVRGNLALIRAMGASLDGTLQDARRSLELASAVWADGRRADVGDDAAGRKATERLLRRLRREVPLFATLSIVSPEGKHLYGDTLAAPENIGAHTFGGYIGDVVFDKGRPQVRVVTQARSRTGELVGVFIANLDLRFISEALSQSRLGRGARLLVVDGDGIPVARSDNQVLAASGSLRGSNVAVDRALATATEGNVESHDVVAVYRNLSSFQSLRGVRWAIVLEQPTRYAFALARETTRDTIIAGSAVLAVALLVGFLLATRLTRPLVQLAAHADAIAENEGDDTAAPAPLDAPGEIGILAQRLVEMAKRIGEREQLQSALSRGDRLSTVGTMSASVAHEINNPLTTVLGYAKLLLEDKDDDHPDRSGLELIADEAERMKTIVGSLLDYSRSEQSGVPMPVDINTLVKRTIALVAPQLRKAHVTIGLDLAEPLPDALADARELQQVFVNLVQNAAQAMPDGGGLTIESRVALDRLAVEVLFTDDGPGIVAADRDRIFDPFYTTKDPGSGTGLGLAVCKHLVNRVGGSIGVVNSPERRGARFRVVIPIEE